MDKSTFQQKLQQYKDMVYRIAYTYLRNMSDAAEVLQDTLLQFLKTAPVFESREHEKAWLLRVAANLSKNRIRYNAVRKTDELQEKLVAEQREDLSFVWDAVKSLPEKYREKYGRDACDELPEIFFPSVRKISAARMRFYDLSAELFVQAFSNTLLN